MALRLSNGQKLHSPEGLEARPTTGLVRQAVMNILAAELPGCRWLDFDPSATIVWFIHSLRVVLDDLN